jgi:hypothetical protein
MALNIKNRLYDPGASCRYWLARQPDTPSK